MSEGTPGRGPDADSRTDNGDGQAPTNGRPTAPPVRYGPRNGSAANGANGGSNARPVSTPSSPQQYRAPQPPQTPSSTPPTNGTSPSSAPVVGPNGSGSNGSGAGGAHAATTGAYGRPRTSGAPARPEPTEQERRIADARIAAAARNASAAKERGGSALGGHTPGAAAPKADAKTVGQSAAVDETAVIPVVPTDDTAVTKPSEPADVTPTTPVGPTTEKERRRFGRLRNRDRRPAQESAAPSVAPEAAAAVAAVEAPVASRSADVTTRAEAAVRTDGEAAEGTAEPGSRTEPAPVTTEQDATAERPMTWRDRLGLAPKEPKAEPAGAAEATATNGSADTTAAAGLASATASTQTAPVQDRVTPSPFAPGGASDTVELAAVDPAAPGGLVPADGATAVPVGAAAAPRPKVGAARRTRKARLRLSRVDPWSVMKTALLFSIAAGIILVVATYGVWSVLNASGLFEAVNDMVKSVVSTPGDTTPFRIEEYVNTQKILGVAALIAVVDVLIFTALATLGSFLYNLAATVLGGLEVTLAED